MQIIVRNSDNVALYSGGSLSSKGFFGNGFSDPRTTTKSASVLHLASIPKETVFGESTYYEGSWAHPVPDVEKRRVELLARAKKEKREKFYSNIVVPFPVDEKEIHFRNDSDRANIGDKTLKAFINVSTGKAQELMTFTTVGKEEISMTSAKLLASFSVLADRKDALFYQFNAVTALIEAATDNDELDAAEAALAAL